MRTWYVFMEMMRRVLGLSLAWVIVASLVSCQSTTGVSSGAPAITSFSADPASITLGDATKLSWTFAAANASTLSIDNGVGDVTGTSSVMVSPARTTTYTLTASDGKTSVTATVTVTVGPTPPPVLLWVDDFESYLVGTFPLSWFPEGNARSDPADNTVVVDPVDGRNRVLQLYGSAPANTTASAFRACPLTADFEVRARLYIYDRFIDSAGSVAINVRTKPDVSSPARALARFASDGKVYMGSGAVTTFHFNQWYDVRLDYERSGGAASLALWLDGTRFGPAEVGISDLSVEQVMGYLGFDVLGGVLVDDVECIPHPGPATRPPTVTALTATPASIDAGGTSALSWTVTGDGPLVLSIAPNVGDVSNASNVHVTPQQTTTYVLTATNAAGIARSQTIVAVVPPSGGTANQAPTAPLLSTPNGTCEGYVDQENVRILWSSTDADADPITYHYRYDASDWAATSAGGQTFTVPGSDFNLHTVFVYATDGRGGISPTVSCSFKVSQPPVITAVDGPDSILNYHAGDRISFAVDVRDPDGQVPSAVTLSVYTGASILLQSSLSAIGPVDPTSTMAFGVFPTFDQTGSFSYVVCAIDALGVKTTCTAQRSFTVAGPVGHPRYPVLLRDTGASMNASERAIVAAAADRWSSIVTGPLSLVTMKDGSCGATGGFPAFTGSTEGLVVDIHAAAIDGAGGSGGNVLAHAWVCQTRSNILPAHAAIEVDSYDLASLASNNGLRDVVLHEIGHSLGFSTPFFSARGYYQGGGTSNPTFTGPNATAEFQVIGGTGAPPLDPTSPSHWSEAVFGTELMTPFIASGAPLSVVTVGLMQDLGYSVDYAQADVFSLSAITTQGLSLGIDEVLPPLHPIP